MIENSAAEQVQVALGGVWDRSYALMLGRVATIEGAAAELTAQHPRAELIDAGRADAHKLAGVLGTFGLHRGTELAQTLEGRLKAPGTTAKAIEAEHLAAELRSVIERAQAG